MECAMEKNLEKCTCSYDSCSRKGKCCECVSYHRRSNELPGCFFPPDAERSYDRSFKKFISCFES
ncbi:MAG: DUF6485 family protein [Deltaproteobacteria bacterium]|jgi:hypothetical protein|nr:DUF6485 family protein [Deltaproteobacteria bacterium]